MPVFLYCEIISAPKIQILFIINIILKFICISNSRFNKRTNITVRSVQKPNSVFIKDDKKQKFIGLGGPGDIVNIFGGEKTRKTGIAVAIASTMLEGGCGTSLLFKGEPNGKNLIHFDTEQSKYYSEYVAIEMTYQAGLPLNEHPPNLFSFPIKGLSKIDRLNFIKHVILNKVKNIGCVYLDGIVDVCRNYNDLEESSDLLTFFLNIAENAGFLLLDVLHNARSTGAARGHLGSELLNKATANLSVTAEKGNNYSSFEVLNKRGEFTDVKFDFYYNDGGHIDLY